jgi:hypothetical protein
MPLSEALFAKNLLTRLNKNNDLSQKMLRHPDRGFTT